MNYRTSTSLSALCEYLQEESCNELLDLSAWLNQGWPHAELRMTVVLLRRVLSCSNITQSDLIAEGFSPPLLDKTLPLLSEQYFTLLPLHPVDDSLNHLYDPTLPIMKFIDAGDYSIHRLSARWMRLPSSSGRETLEWMMLKKNSHIVGWILMPQA